MDCNLAARGTVATENSIKRLFVYGSLMEGFFNYEKALKGKVLSRAHGRVRGILYHQTVKAYPAMVAGDGWVAGEILELDDFDRVLEIGDRIESYEGPHGKDNEYDRRITDIEADGKIVRAWAYWYSRNDLGTPQNPAILIPNGDWRKFMELGGGNRSLGERRLY